MMLALADGARMLAGATAGALVDRAVAETRGQSGMLYQWAGRVASVEAQWLCTSITVRE